MQPAFGSRLLNWGMLFQMRSWLSSFLRYMRLTRLKPRVSSGLDKHEQILPSTPTATSLPHFLVTSIALLKGLTAHTHSEGPSKANSRPHRDRSQVEAGCSTPIALCCSFGCEQGMAHPYDTHRASCDAAFNVGYIIISHVGWRVACCPARATLHRRSVSSVRARPQPNTHPCRL